MLTDSSEGPGRLPRGRHGLPRELVAHSQRQRLLAGVVKATVAKGCAETTVADILAEAGVGRESFYQLFDDRLDCMLAAHTVFVDQIEAGIREAYSRPGPWPERVVNALATTLAAFAADPEATRFSLVEITAVGPAFRTLFEEDFGRFVGLLGGTMPEEGPPPAVGSAPSLAIGATVAIVYREAVAGRTAGLPALLPELAYEFLLPLIGEDHAREEQHRAAKRAPIRVG